MSKDDSSGLGELKSLLADSIKKEFFGDSKQTKGKPAPSESVLGAFFEGVLEGVEDVRSGPSIMDGTIDQLNHVMGYGSGSLPQYMLSSMKTGKRRKKWWQWF